MRSQVSYAAIPFEPSATPTLEAATAWLASLLTGGLAIGLCVIAIAVLGLLMLGGRLPVRNGLRMVLGCFVLLGSPMIAQVFISARESGAEQVAAFETSSEMDDPRRDLPASAEDPYAGASLRRD